METRRIKARNGEGLSFSVVGEGTGPLGDFYELLDEKTSIATIEAGARERRQSVRLIASLRQRAGGSADGRGA